MKSLKVLHCKTIEEFIEEAEKHAAEDGTLIIRRLLDKVAAEFGVAPDRIDRHRKALAARLSMSPEILEYLIHFSPSSRRILRESDFDTLARYCGYSSFREFLDKECNDLPRLRYVEGEWHTCAGRGRDEKGHVAQTDSAQNNEGEDSDLFVVPEDVFKNVGGDDFIPGILIDKDNLPLFEKFMKYVHQKSGISTRENWEALIHLFTGYKYSHGTKKVKWDCQFSRYTDRILGYLVQKLFKRSYGKFNILKDNVEWINIDRAEKEHIDNNELSQYCAGGKGIPSPVMTQLSEFYPSLQKR